MLRTVLIAVALVLAANPVAAMAQLVLRDGSVVNGVSARRQGDLFLLAQKDGSVATIPAANVKELRLLDDPDAPATNVRVKPPQVVAGPTPEIVAPPTRGEQLAVFPETEMRPKRSPIPYEWAPTDAFAGKGGNQFNPARWYRSPIDPTWTPTSAFTYGSDVTNFRPARWTRVIESIWVPKDGFADAVSNPNRSRVETKTEE